MTKTLNLTRNDATNTTLASTPWWLDHISKPSLVPAAPAPIEYVQWQSYLKWAGSKASVAGILQNLMPASYGTFHEHFFGSGGFLFNRTNRTTTEHCVVSDTNAYLIRTHRAVQACPDAVIHHLNAHRAQHSETYYYDLRDKVGMDDDNDAVVAARFIYFNFATFNGLWRVNSKGKFNASWGKRKADSLENDANIRAASCALQGVTLRITGYEDMEPHVKAGDFVYFDPPYVPLSKTANFEGYTEDGFGMTNQKRLAELFLTYQKRGAYVMATNHDTPVVRELYAGARFETMDVLRRINRDGDKRGAVKEAIILSY